MDATLGRPAVPLRATRLGAGAVVGGLGCLVAAIAVGVLVGPASLAPGAILREVADALPFVSASSGLGSQEAAILWQLRLPRVVLGALVGSTLAMAGAGYQGVFRNPLADPYLLGVAAGAGLGATLAVAYAGIGLGTLPLAAFAGAVLAVAATYALGRSGLGARTSATLILAGVAVAALLTAAQTFVQQRRSETLREVYTWILGGLGTARWEQVRLILPYVVVSAVILLLHRRLLDVMSVGDEEASSLGIRATRTRLVVVGVSTLATAAAVSVSGLIGFVGIIVPHTVRLVAGPSYRRVLPLSLVFGGAFLVAADVLARVALSPAEIPLGVVTAFFGAPFFLVVLRRSRRIG